MTKYELTERGKGIVVFIIAVIVLTSSTIVAVGAWDGSPARAPPYEAVSVASQNFEPIVTNNFAGEVWTTAGTGTHGAEDGYPAQFNLPRGIFGGDDGTLYIADTFNNLIRNIDTEQYVRRVTGDVLVHDETNFPHGFYMDTELDAALFNRPTDVLVDTYGRLVMADSENNSIRIVVGQRVYTFAGSAEAGHADGSSREARFNRPTAISLCPSGYIYVADTLNHAIRRIDPDGNVTTVAGTPGIHGSRDGAANSAQLNRPSGIAVSQTGRIYIADTGNHLIRVIENGVLQTLAGTLRFTSGIAWEVPTDIDDVPLGGLQDGFDAMFNTPMGLELWNGNLIVADSMNHVIRAILPTGETITIAGAAYPGYTNAPAGRAAFHMPAGLYVRENTLYIADTGNNTIRAMELVG